MDHLVFDGIADGPVALGLEIGRAAAQLVHTGRVPHANVPREMRLVSVDGAPVRTSAGRLLEVDGALELRSRGRGDVLLLPGIGMATPHAIEAALGRADVVRGIGLLRRARKRGVVVGASCSSTFVLAAAGILDGREATTTWWLAPTFARRFPRVSLRSDRMVVASRGVLTAGAAFAHADLVLAVLARSVSPSLAHLVAKYLVLDERASQARYMVLDHVRTSDPVVQAAERFVTKNLERQITLAEMAHATATSPRTLARRLEAALGTTPIRFAQRIRIAAAVHLLETTRLSVAEVASRVGYADPAAFRRILRRETGEPPSALRRA